MTEAIRTAAKACLLTATLSIISLSAPVLTGVSSAAAPTPPAWEPDSNAAPPYGNIQLFDANGVVVTSGSTASQPFAWAAATTEENTTAGGSLATAYFRDPSSAKAPASWAGPQESNTTTFSPAPTGASTPATVEADAASGVNGTPIVQMHTAAQNDTIDYWAAHNALDANAAYDYIIDMVIQTSGGNGGNIGQGTYWNTDIGFCPTSHSGNCTAAGVSIAPGQWQQLFPFAAAPSSTPTLGLSAPSPITSGTSETLMASNVPTPPPGSVVFEDNGVAIATVTPTGSSASYTYAPATGAHSYTASYVPNTSSAESNADTANATLVDSSTSSPVALTVNAAATPTSTTVQPSTPASPVTNQPITFNANVMTTGGSPTPPDGGTVSFDVGAGTICSGPVSTSTGNASCTSSAGLAAGSYTLTATYSGDPSFGSSHGSQALTVGMATTSSALTSSPAVPSDSTTFTLRDTITPQYPGAQAPSGTETVNFENGSTTITGCGAAPIVNWVATCTVSGGLPGGTYTLNAVYSGDTNFVGSTGTISGFSVLPASSTSLASAPDNPSVVGEGVTYTASVVPKNSADHTVIADGSVAFTDGGTPIASCGTNGVVNVTSGQAACSVPATTGYTAPGSHSIVATYSGGSAYGGSSGSLTQAVNKANTSTTVNSAAPNPSVFGNSVTYTATVAPASPGAGTPAGSVQFNDGSLVLCSASLSSGTAHCTSQSEPAGPGVITATYAGDGNFNTSTDSSGIAHTVNPGTTSTALSSSVNPVVTSNNVTYTATVSVTSGAGTPTGTVSFNDSVSGPITGCSTASLSGGKATCTVSYPSAGSHSITAVYTSGDGNFTGSPSAAYSETAIAPTVPTAPTLRKATAGNSQVILTWAAPSSDGHSAIQGYNVYVGTAAGGESVTPVNSALISGTSYTVNRLTNKTQYFFTVKAVNAVGSSPTSNELSATPSQAAGYWLLGSDGGVYSFGGAPFDGSLGNVHLVAPIVAMVHTPNHDGYWLVGSDGGVFAFGHAKFQGSLGDVHLVAPIVALVPTASGNGYWLIGSDGGVFSFGDAKFHGSLGAVHLAKPIVGAIASQTSNGYILVASDGGVFGFGDGKFAGSLGNIKLVAPIVGIAPAPDGDGYLLAASDGGIFAFGHGAYHGSLGGVHLARPIVAIVPAPGAAGYWLIGNDGGVFAFGTAAYHGSVPGVGVDVSNIVGGA